MKFGDMENFHTMKFDVSDAMGNFDWRQAIAKPLAEGDIEGMKMAALPSAELNMLHLAHTAQSEAVKFQATAFIISQNGHGPMTRVEHTMDYKKMPKDQLVAIVQAKIISIRKLNPEFDFTNVLNVPRETNADPIEAEFEADEESVTE